MWNQGTQWFCGNCGRATPIDVLAESAGCGGEMERAQNKTNREGGIHFTKADAGQGCEDVNRETRKEEKPHPP